MSTLATAPERAGEGARPDGAARRRTDRFAEPAAAVAGAAGIVALAFLTSHSAGPNAPLRVGYTWSEITITALGATACGAAVWLRPRGRAWGLGAVTAFAAFAALAALSITWAVQPDWAWYGANQLLAYLAAFAGGVALARTWPARWRVLIGAVAIATAVIAGYALLAKVFPATLASTSSFGRLLAPYGYWNALGVCAAMGLPAWMWWGTRPGPGAALRGLAVPAISLLLSVIVLSYSRSALLAGVLAVALWLVVVPGRRRGAVVLGVGVLGALPIVLWALGHRALTGDGIPLATQDGAGHTFGAVLAVTLAVTAVAGWAAVTTTERIVLSSAAQRRIDAGAFGLLALVPVGAVVLLASSSRGLTGEISYAWQSLTSSHSVVFDTSSRLAQLGSSRPTYWHEGLQVGAHHLLVGAGGLGYGIARLRYTTSLAPSNTAHSYLVQTFSDLGLLGLALTAVLFAAWALAARRALAPRSSWGALGTGRAAERAGLVAITGTVLAFGVQSALDWTWYFAGLAVPALICAGWLAGRGPLTTPTDAATPAGRLRDRPAAGLGLTLLAALALAGAWIQWEPLHSAQLISAAENESGYGAAVADARAAARSDPLSIAPLNLLANLYRGSGQNGRVREALVHATAVQPANPESWLALGSLDLQLGRLTSAVTELQRVAQLDHTGDVTRQLALTGVTESRAGLATQAAAAKAAKAKAVSSRSRARGQSARRGASRAARRHTRH